jgi:Tol biopolymer transport system component
MSSTSRVRIPAALAVLAALTAAPALGAKGDLDLGSRQSAADGGAGANSWSSGGALSASGRYLAFMSEARNLDVEDGFRSIYVYDFGRRVVENVSRASDFGPPSDGDDVDPQISANGRFVAFETDATNLGGPTQHSENIYVYDRKLDDVELVSRQSASAGGQGADNESSNPSISANGRYVAFTSRASNLGGPINTDPFDANVYVYDRKEDRVFLGSRRSNNGKGGNEASYDPVLAPNAPVVVFSSQSRNLGGPINNDEFESNVYAYDWRKRKTELVSRRSKGGKGANGEANVTDVSGKGRQILFTTSSRNLGGPIKNVPDDASIAYVRDLKTSRTTLVSRRAKNGPAANGSASDAVISDSGRHIAYATTATNLGGPTRTALNVYVYDRKTKRLTLASRGTNGGPGADESASSPAIAGREPLVIFTTAADNIDPPGQPAYHGNFPPATSIFRFQFAR